MELLIITIHHNPIPALGHSPVYISSLTHAKVHIAIFLRCGRNRICRSVCMRKPYGDVCR